MEIEKEDRYERHRHENKFCPMLLLHIAAFYIFIVSTTVKLGLSGLANNSIQLVLEII